MAWNYRVTRMEWPDYPDPDDQQDYDVREVWYAENNDDHPNGWTESSSTPHGSSRDAFQDDWCRWLVAFAKPVLVIRGETIVGTEPPICATGDAMADIIKTVLERRFPQSRRDPVEGDRSELRGLL